MKGAKFLKVTGILMIVFGAIGIVTSLISIPTIMASLEIIAAFGAMADVHVSVGGIWIAIILGLVGTALELVAGILGVMNAQKPEKAKLCMIMGIAVAGLSVISSIVMLVSFAESFNIVSLLLGLVVPGLYIFGAYKNTQG